MDLTTQDQIYILFICSVTTVNEDVMEQGG